MKILADIGHPGHYHMLKKSLSRAIAEGHEVTVILRDKDNAGLLTSQLELEIIPIDGHKRGLFRKALYAFITQLRILMILSRVKPDVVLAESNFYLAQCAWLMRIPSVMLAMNDHARLENSLFRHFCTKVITSNTFKGNFGKRHIRFRGYLQWIYLNNFTPDDAGWNLGISLHDSYAIIRLVYWGAHHDIGKYCLSEEQIVRIIASLKGYKVFISSEKTLPETLRRYALPTAPEHFHNVLYHSSLCISEGSGGDL